jgi:hypothetical protein
MQLFRSDIKKSIFIKKIEIFKFYEDQFINYFNSKL